MREFHFDRIPKPALAFELQDRAGLYKGVDLEIGAGQGLHAIQYAKANPDRLLLAVEKTHTRAALLEQRRQNHPELSNLQVFQADAVAFVTHFLGAATLDRVFLLYPNPYAKAKHANLRWHNRPFLRQLLNAMKPGGQLTMATNLEWCAFEARAAFLNTWQLQELSFAPIAPHSVPRTHFEKKYLARGEKCWNLVYQKS
jgi:tRNA (guanine-N7-)-methyltransferase